MYKTTELRQFFSVSRQTISAWCIEFAEYLSPTATPPGNTHRQLTDDDLRVLTLVSEMSRAGRPFAEIHLALRSGQRGDLPEIHNGAVIPVDTTGQLSLFRARVMDLEMKIENLQKERDEAVGRAKELRDQYEKLMAEMRDLYREMGRLEAQIPRTPND